MLPGFRFLFAAIVLSLSILVFGLGAAALLRAAHEEFASTPTWRAAPEMVFAQPVETTRPVLALLRVDTPAVEKTTDNAPSDATPAATTAPSEPERIAALKPEDSSSPETAKPEATVAESPAQGEAAAAPAEPSAVVAETKSAEAKSAETKSADAKDIETQIAMSEDTASPAIQPAAPMTSEPAAAPASPQATTAATKIATLGGPAVTIETPRPAKAASAKMDSVKTGSNIIKKRQHARRAVKRRRLAARARLAAELPQQPANPFGQPTPTIVRRR
jgi:hypothetical protein